MTTIAKEKQRPSLVEESHTNKKGMYVATINKNALSGKSKSNEERFLNALQIYKDLLNKWL